MKNDGQGAIFFSSLARSLLLLCSRDSVPELITVSITRPALPTSVQYLLVRPLFPPPRSFPPLPRLSQTLPAPLPPSTR